MGRFKLESDEKKVTAGVFVKSKILETLGKKEAKQIGEEAIEYAYHEKIRKAKK